MWKFELRPAIPEDIDACIAIRGRTRENPVSASRLAELGITSASWSKAVQHGTYVGFMAIDAQSPLGFCFGDAGTGEILVLAVLPEFESKGIGRALLATTMNSLRDKGHLRLFLGADGRPHIRAHGFYRHLGWKPSGNQDELGDDELEYFFDGSKNT